MRKIGWGMTPDQVIELMRAAKRPGTEFQKRTQMFPKWCDIDLREYLKETVQYRIKPKKHTRNPKP